MYLYSRLPFKLQIFFVMTFVCSCAPDSCPNMEDKTIFYGDVLVYYYRPVSGNMYQVMFIPICTKEKNINIEKLNSEKLGMGISMNISGSGKLMSYLEAHAIPYKLAQREQLDVHLQKVYLTSMRIKFDKIENNTEQITKLKQNISDNLILPWGTVTINYFVSATAEIKSFNTTEE